MFTLNIPSLVRLTTLVIVAMAASIAFGCGGDSREVVNTGDSLSNPEFTVSSTGLRDGGKIPGR